MISLAPFVPLRKKRETEEREKQKIIAKAWKDPAFKQKLNDNPQEAFKELGLEFPQNCTFSVVDELSDQGTLVIPQAPSNSQKLTTDQLEGIAAAWSRSGAQVC